MYTTTPSIHEPVMVREVLDTLALSPGLVVVDATLGGGGHAREILERVQPGGAVLGIEWDPDIVRRSPRASGLTVIAGDYANMTALVHGAQIQSVDRVLFDFGMNSFHLDHSERGFSFGKDAPLDMRFNPTSSASAADIVNMASESELTRIFQTYGEERHAGRIARHLVEARKKRPILRTTDLVSAILKCVPLGGKTHPATHIFQALRIAVNDELAHVAHGIAEACALVVSRGRVAALSYHSLEHRTVKFAFRDACSSMGGRMVTKHAVKPSREEVLSNRRARSAQLRVWEKI